MLRIMAASAGTGRMRGPVASIPRAADIPAQMQPNMSQHLKGLGGHISPMSQTVQPHPSAFTFSFGTPTGLESNQSMNASDRAFFPVPPWPGTTQARVVPHGSFFPPHAQPGVQGFPPSQSFSHKDPVIGGYRP